MNSWRMSKINPLTLRSVPEGNIPPQRGVDPEQDVYSQTLGGGLGDSVGNMRDLGMTTSGTAELTYSPEENNRYYQELEERQRMEQEAERELTYLAPINEENIAQQMAKISGRTGLTTEEQEQTTTMVGPRRRTTFATSSPRTGA